VEGTSSRCDASWAGHLCSVTYKEAAELGIDDLKHVFFVNTQLDPDKETRCLLRECRRKNPRANGRQ
jgi:hypothetical protein